ncbi:MAG TPA: error-prone DNA polymerase [Pirellulales bacterium]|jgi:error-prone DNA polymerase
MPDPPPAKREVHLATPPPADVAEPAAPYAELHAKTNFSFLIGASHPDELVARAAELGYRALAVTDRESLAGVVRAYAAAKTVGLKLLVGAEIHPLDAPPVVLLAIDRSGYANLSRMLSLGRRRAPKGECLLHLQDLAEHATGILALAYLPTLQATSLPMGDEPAGRDAILALREREISTARQVSGPPPALSQRERGFEIPATTLAELPATTHSVHAPHAARALNTLDALLHYREIFTDRCYALAELHRGPDDRQVLAEMVRLAAQAGLPLVAANDVHYHVPERRALADVLSATRQGITVAEAGPHEFANAERHLQSPDEMAELFADHPEAIARTVEIAERCSFSLEELRYEYPEELCPPGITALAHLTQLTWHGAQKRYPQGIPPKVRTLVEHELVLIEKLHYEAYFLTVWDLIRYARSRDILCQGRGSAANSAVCYCLGVTSVDPEQIDVLFERFVSLERNEAPDIDIDFEHERREEVLQYVYDKYGRERAGMTAEVITYRLRSAVRDVGKALGLSLDRVDALAKTIDGRGYEDRWREGLREAGIDASSTLGRQLAALVEQLVGFPRHLSQHVGGMVMTRGPLCEMVPIENAAMPGRTVIQWDKDDLDTLGILKVDCLALGMLTAIHKCFDLVEQHYGRQLTLANIPQADEAVYEMICHADTMGVFQIESRAQMSMLPRLQPRKFYDLVIEVAIVRPGPIQGNMVHPYLRRRAGLEPVSFPNDEISEVLKKTMGVPIFQEQAMRLAVVAAGFTPGEADQLRRAMGAWRKTGVIEKFRQKLITGMLSRGLTLEFAENVFHQISGFGEYGFPESHSASFALLVYVSAWLKHYYPAAFAAALVNSQPMGFYAPAQLVRDAREHGVKVLPVDVNLSEWDCTLEEGPEFALRLGLRLLLGLPAGVAERISTARGAGSFRSLDDLARRARLGRPLLVRLVKADAVRSLDLDRRTGLWQALAAGEQARALPLFDPLPEAAEQESAALLPALTTYEEVLADYQTAGLSLRAHPMSFLRATLTPLGVIRANELSAARHGRQVRVAGLVLVRQRPGTASGITFVTLEDETGVANLVIRPDIWQRFRPAAKNAVALLAQGRLERQGEVIHILANRLIDVHEISARMDSHSRDFH